jgi:isopenicillin-N epimerase
MLDRWCLDPEVTYLNHGTVGATPKRVLAAQQAMRDVIERQPSQFLLRELVGVIGDPPPKTARLRMAAAAIAEFVRSRPDDLVFVDNATAGANAVLRCCELRPGDEILMSDHAYGAVTNVARFNARERDATVRVVELPFPVRAPEQIVDAFAAAIGPRTRLAIVDHITSGSAMLLPLAAIATRCRSRGVPVLADGAHAPGAIDLDIPSLGVDWYTANLHKWAWAPRSCGILWAAPERQAGLHPPVVSWGFDQGFTAEFDWVGTRDPSPWLVAPEAIAMMRELGVEAVRDYNHALALEAVRRLSDGVGAEPTAPDRMTGTMATVQLPASYGSTHEDATRLRDALLFEDRVEVQLHAWRDRMWMRISAQVYNDAGDLERLVSALTARCPA